MTDITKLSKITSFVQFFSQKKAIEILSDRHRSSYLVGWNFVKFLQKLKKIRQKSKEILSCDLKVEQKKIASAFTKTQV